MSQENVEIVRAFFRGWNEGGLDGMMEVFDADVAYLPVEVAETLHGSEAVRRYFQGWLDAWDEFHVEPTEFLDTGDHVVVGEALTGRGKGSGVEIAMEFWSVSLLRDNHVVRRDEYLDRADALEAAGLSE